MQPLIGMALESGIIEVVCERVILSIRRNDTK